MSHLIRLLLTVPANLWSGYVASIMWAWYVEPLGAPHLDAVRAVGLFFLIRLFAPSAIRANKPMGEEYTGGELLFISAVVWVLGPALTLFFGWAWKHAL